MADCGGSVAGACIGTFLGTILLVSVGFLVYKKWRRHKGKHLVLVTDPEIVEDAYAFDNPCFKDATPAVGRSLERPVSSLSSTPTKDNTRWSSPWSTLGLATANRKDKRRTLDDSCVGPKAARISVVSLRSRDFTGLGFNVCGNMREGIFVKDLLHRGPASESGLIHPGDRILSVKISFRNMVFEDALTILSYASPYDVELEVENGGSGSKPTTMLKKTVGPSPTRICHPLYRSQSIPELSSKPHKNSTKRLFAADPNESAGSASSSVNNSTSKSHKSTSPVGHEKDQPKTSQHYKFGIKVLPALDGTVHRIEKQNDFNTNLERRNSKKVEKTRTVEEPLKATEKSQQRENSSKSLDEIMPAEIPQVPDVIIPSEVPTEVHNAAVAARRNRKNSPELLCMEGQSMTDSPETKSPQKSKRKAPAPPKVNVEVQEMLPKKREVEEDKMAEPSRWRERRLQRMTSESDTDSEVQNSFMTIELNSADITIHHTPVPEVEDPEDDVYRKAASLGDLSRFENKACATLERAQSLDMTDASLKKRKAPVPPEDITESTEDLTRLDDMEAMNDRRKLKKSSEWGTLQDAIWTGKGDEADEAEACAGGLGRSKSAQEIKLGNDETEKSNVSDESSVELFNLPLSKRLSEKFLASERIFDVNQDNSLARIINNGRVVKSPTPEQVELDFRQVHLLQNESSEEGSKNQVNLEKNEAKEEAFEKARRFLDDPDEEDAELEEPEIDYSSREEVVEKPLTKVVVNYSCPCCDMKLGRHHEHCNRKLVDDDRNAEANVLDDVENSNKIEVKKFKLENPSSQVYLHQSNPTSTTIQVKDASFSDNGIDLKSSLTPRVDSEKIEEDRNSTHFAKRIFSGSSQGPSEDEDADDGYEFGSISKKSVSSSGERYNVSNVSVSSGENSEDSGLVRESSDSETRPPLPSTPMPNLGSAQSMTYITEIKVSTGPEKVTEVEGEVKDAVTLNGKSGKKPPVPPRRSDHQHKVKEDVHERQVVYVSEFKSMPKEAQSPGEKDKSTSVNQKFEHWTFINENKDQHPWGNGSSSLQPITNIVLSSGDEKIVRK